jgi:dTDP-4-dehydrorhamnose 3,5-epimerase
MTASAGGTSIFASLSQPQTVTCPIFELGMRSLIPRARCAWPPASLEYPDEGYRRPAPADLTPVDALAVGDDGCLAVFGDERGYFFETYKTENYAQICENLTFVQDNISMSAKGTLRGLHFQAPPFAQGKLIQVLQGAVLDVAVDIRRSSPTYGQHFKMVLSAENATQLYIPPGFAHGFVALEDDTVFSYKCTKGYAMRNEGSLRWNDPDLNIDWKVIHPILSEKDKEAACFTSFQSPF